VSYDRKTIVYSCSNYGSQNIVKNCHNAMAVSSTRVKTRANTAYWSRNIVYAIAGRSQKTCRLLCEHIPATYKSCQSFSDLWETYQLVFPLDTMREIVTLLFNINHNLSLTC